MDTIVRHSINIIETGIIEIEIVIETGESIKEGNYFTEIDQQ